MFSSHVSPMNRIRRNAHAAASATTAVNSNGDSMELVAVTTANGTLCNNNSNSKASHRDTRAAVFILNGPRWHLHKCLEKEAVNCKGMLLQHSSKTIGVPASPN